METRRIGGVEVSAIGLGCMSLSHAYGAPPSRAEGLLLIAEAIDLGASHFDTAALYGFGANEELIGEALKAHRNRIFLASKCGLTGVDGKRVIDGRPNTLKQTCDEALKRLQTEVIDLYYLHRWDKCVPIEDSIGAMGDLVHSGKVRMLGLSEVSGPTLRRAHAVHPIAAVQSEYSLWTRNPEIAVLDACRELGATLVAFSPLGRGFLASELTPATFTANDIRRTMPRFQPPHLAANHAARATLAALADEIGHTPAQIALAWVLAKAAHVTPIPGTTRLEHVRENHAAASIQLPPEVITRLDALSLSFSGQRYNAATQAEIDTEN